MTNSHGAGAPFAVSDESLFQLDQAAADQAVAVVSEGIWRGLGLAAPRTIDLHQRASLPILLVYRDSYEILRRAPPRSEAFVVVSRVAAASGGVAVFPVYPVPRERGRPPPPVSLPEGAMESISEVAGSHYLDLRPFMGALWAPGSCAITIICAGGRTNTVLVTLTAGGPDGGGGAGPSAPPPAAEEKELTLEAPAAWPAGGAELPISGRLRGPISGGAGRRSVEATLLVTRTGQATPVVVRVAVEPRPESAPPPPGAKDTKDTKDTIVEGRFVVDLVKVLAAGPGAGAALVPGLHHAYLVRGAQIVGPRTISVTE